MEKGRDRFGVSDLEYDMVTTLSNLLQAEEAMSTYMRDAEKAGEKECAEIFRMIQENNRKAATQLRDTLARKMSAVA